MENISLVLRVNFTSWSFSVHEIVFLLVIKLILESWESIIALHDVLEFLSVGSLRLSSLYQLTLSSSSGLLVADLGVLLVFLIVPDSLDSVLAVDDLGDLELVE